MPNDFENTKIFVPGEPPHQKVEKLLSTFNENSLKPAEKSIAQDKKNMLFEYLMNKKKYNNFLKEERERRLGLI